MIPRHSIRTILTPMACLLLTYICALTWFTGDIGFEGDDWWIFSFAYWNTYPASITAYAQASLRPLEGVYWMTLFEIFGFNKIAFHFCSLLLLSGSTLAMTACLLKAFPRHRDFAVISGLFASFLPTVAPLTYVMCTDNSRLAMLMFWLSVWGFQKWYQKDSKWYGLLLPCILYLLSFFTYEAAGLLIFSVPLLVWPLRAFNKKAALLLGCTLGGSLVVAVAARSLLLGGGAVGQKFFIPPPDLILGYLGLAPFYLIAPFQHPVETVFALAAGLAIAGAAFLIFTRCGLTSESVRSRGFILLLGIIIFLLGILPYQLAGYGTAAPTLVDTVLSKLDMQAGPTTWFNFNWSGRLYSAGTAGIAILLGLFATMWSGKQLRVIGRLGAAIVIGFMACFQAGLAKDWQEAGEIRNNVIKSLISQVPDVKVHTNFVFVDLASDHNRAPVFRGWGGLRELVRMLYNEREVCAWYLFPYEWKWPNQRFQRGIVRSRGFLSRAMDESKPAPHDTLLVLKREGAQVVLLDSICPNDGVVQSGICWEGSSQLKTNWGRILGYSSPEEAPKSHDAWSSGLISTLQLANVESKTGFIQRWADPFRWLRVVKTDVAKAGRILRSARLARSSMHLR